MFLLQNFGRTDGSWSLFKPLVLIFGLFVLPPANMSWDAHVSAAVAEAPMVKGALMFGKDGTIWGKHGDIGNICPSELKEFVSQSGKRCGCHLNGQKFMFIKDEDGLVGYRGGPVSVGGYVGANHCELIIGSDGASVPSCLTGITKFKEYMQKQGQS